MGRPKVSRRQVAYRKRILSRKKKKRKIKVITRKEQVGIEREIEIYALKKQDVVLSAVASSWIADLGYIAKRKVVTMVLTDGHIYHIIGVPFEVFEEWLHAHSKGTFWHVKNIKDNYKIIRIR